MPTKPPKLQWRGALAILLTAIWAGLSWAVLLLILAWSHSGSWPPSNLTRLGWFNMNSCTCLEGADETVRSRKPQVRQFISALCGLSSSRSTAMLKSLRLIPKGQGQKPETTCSFGFETSHHFYCILLVNTSHKVNQNSKGWRKKSHYFFMGRRRNHTIKEVYIGMERVIMVIFANNLSQALFCIFHPFCLFMLQSELSSDLSSSC